MKDKTTLSCLIIEDEPIAAEVLTDYIGEVAFLELKGVCTDALFALDRLQKEPIEVIFLDIHLPKLKGLDFLKVLSRKPQTILTTAYDEYALEAFEAEVVDYLLKPIAFTRFLKAVHKLQWTRPEEARVPEIPAGEPPASRSFRFFNVNKRQVKVFYDEVLYIESLKDYSRIFTSGSALVTRGQIGEMETAFAPFGFLRIHRSFLVSLDKIRAYTATSVEIEGKSLPIGRNYRTVVLKTLEAFGNR